MGLAKPTDGPRIVPFGAARLPTDKLSNGRPGFRVTQRFADPDKYLGGRHGALDLGNYNCGDRVLASVAGTVRNLKDSYGALIVEIREPSGAIVGYGHLGRYRVANGAKVNRGAHIGDVGMTGLGGVCHVHYYRKSSTGVLQDPWPQLDQNSTRQAKLNATTGINIRSGPGAVGGPMPALYASAVNGRIIRTSDKRDLGSAASYYTARSPVYGATHNVGATTAAKKQWTQIYLAGAYRAVATPLVTYR